jgi:hypothetical protein
MIFLALDPIHQLLFEHVNALQGVLLDILVAPLANDFRRQGPLAVHCNLQGACNLSRCPTIVLANQVKSFRQLGHILDEFI